MTHALIALFMLAFWTVSLWSAPQVSQPGSVIGGFMGCGAVAGKIPKTDAAGIAQCSDDAGASSGAPTTSTYMLRTLDGALPNAFVWGNLATALILNTTGTGIPTTYAGTGPVANQLLRSLNALGVGTFGPVVSADITDGTLVNADVNAAAAIAESKLALTFPTHSSANDPTANEKAALDGADTGGAPTGSNKYVVNDDNRLASQQTPSPLSSSSQITCTKPTQYIEGSAGPVILSNAAWLVNGTFPGQSCELIGSHATSTVTGPTTASVINCGGTGSVVIGKNAAKPLYVWTGSLWEQKGCATLQQAADTGAAPLITKTGTQLQLREGTSGFDLKVVSSFPVIEGVCSGGSCDIINKIPAGKVYEVRNNADVPKLTVVESTGVVTNATLDVEGTGNNFTTYDEVWNDAAGCNNVTPGHIWDVPTANAPVATCDPAGPGGYLAFNDTTDQSIRFKFRLPTGFTGAIDYIPRWKSAAITGAVGWCVQLVRVPVGATSFPALPAQAAGNCVSDTAAGTTLQENEATINGVTCTSCAAGDLIYGAISRDANGGAVTDSMTGDALLLGWTRRVRMTK